MREGGKGERRRKGGQPEEERKGTAEGSKREVKGREDDCIFVKMSGANGN